MYTQEQFSSQLREDSPWKVYLFGSVSTTMDEARRLANEYPDQDFLVAVAETQSAGRGRLDRTWESTEEGLWMTAVLRPQLPLGHAPRYTLAAAVAVAETLRNLGFDVSIKWPNDVLVAQGAYARHKLCGIRCEVQGDGQQMAWISIGIGVNVDQESFAGQLQDKAASLRQLSGKPLSRSSIACAILERLEDAHATMQRDGFQAVRERWMSLALGIGQGVQVQEAGRAIDGILHGIDSEGRVLVQEQDGPIQALAAGDLVFEV